MDYRCICWRLTTSIIGANAGWRWQARLCGLRHWSGVAEFTSLAESTMNTTLTLLVLLALVDGSSAQNLLQYADCDLRKLNTNEVSSLRAAFKSKTGVELGEKWGWRPLAPWILAAYETPKTAWVLVEAYPGYDVPDVSGMKVHFFDKSWTPVCSVSFPTGYRFFLNEVTLQKRQGFDTPLIVAKATSAGPFITSPGPKRPAFEQGDFQLQYYALLHTNLFMVRLEDNQGVLAHNHYRWRNPPKGPEVPTRTKEEWITFLESSNVVEQFSALVWLTGAHLSSQAPRMADQNQESVEDSKRFESVRDDPRTAQTMNRLRVDRNQWVQQYAELGFLENDNE